MKKNELGFPYAIYSIAFVSANIPKTSSNTSSINLLLKDSNLQQFLSNSNILANIPLNHISGSITNEEFSERSQVDWHEASPVFFDLILSESDISDLEDFSLQC